MAEPAAQVRVRPSRLLVFNGARLELWPDCVRTVFADGAEVVAAPQTDAEYRRTAASLGYGLDTRSMNEDHDACHLWAAQLLAGRADASPTLRAVALGTRDQLPDWLLWGEEGLALALARYALTGQGSPELAALVIAGVDLADWRRHARQVLSNAVRRSSSLP